ncbi:hypothetical protein MKS88_000822 [Plasmodium brasilianum]|uniref:Uncharacterized protein n=1 Tax=Plasmodium brasilianum TaxID=5824 RepID=A0ACB9YGX2_PLABR|nr:hypothetical protein MKS88_000822 [Plasmodium brasilianum]
MDNCFSEYYNSYGTQTFTISRLSVFKNIENEIKQKTSSLINENDKDTFRNGCFYLADYLIKNKNPPQLYKDHKKTWKGTLNYKLNNYYKNLVIHGGCPLILEEDDKKILKLKYEEIDFCEKKKRDLDEIKALSTNQKNHNTYIKFTCDLRNKETFKTLTECSSLRTFSPPQSLYEKKVTLPSQGQETPKTSYTGKASPEKDGDKKISQDTQETQQELPSTLQPEPPSNVHKSQSETTAMGSEPSSTGDMQVKPSQYSTHFEAPPPEAPTFYKPPDPDPQASEAHIDADIVQSPGMSTNDSLPSVLPTSSKILSPAKNPHNNSISLILTSILVIIIFTIFIKYALIGRLKKKKKIKRRQMKFLRILIPSLYDKKSKFLTHYHTESLLHDEESIIKKLKIHEHDIKNLNIQKQKKDRFKTIIEIHMEVLEEFRNEEWEHKKGEFLELCLEMFAEEEYKTYPNLSNRQLIMENTKSINDIEKQKILCNKWIKEHRNISEKLKKTVWFNYLKNEWKKEKDFIKNSEKLKVNFSNKIQKDSFSAGEKDLWREWISKKHMIIEQYLEQEWYEEMTQELLNTIDEHVNEEIINNTLLLSTEELQQKVSYDELYKYIKKKLLAKLCILVFMMVLEECKKEDFIENEGLHLDSYINDCTTEVNLGTKSNVTKEIIEFNASVLENTEYKKIPAYTGEEGLSQEIKKWVRVEDTPENSIYNENIVE